jgi:two-component system chemotaxis sensor kinase CheA
MATSQSELDEFKNEAYELLDVAEKSLMGLDQGEDFKNCYNAIFRSLHNLKGGSGMMDMLELQKHTHELETIFTQFQDQGHIPHEYLNFFLKGIDAARMILAGDHVQFDYSVKKKTSDEKIVIKDEVASESLTKGFSIEEFIMNCSDYTENIVKNLQLIESGKSSSETFNDLYREVHSLKGDAYLFSFNLIGDIAHAMENALEPLRDGRHKVSKNLMSCLFKSIDVIELFLNLKEKTKNPTPALKKIVNAVTEALAVSSGKTEEEKSVPQSLIHKFEKETKEHKESKETKEGESLGSIRVPVSLLDNLMTLMGEMVLVRNQVLQYSCKTEDLEFLSMSKRLNVVTSEIQEQMMKTRMQSIGNVLGKFNRVVRDLSGELGKSIAVSIEGAETELDKSLLEAIKDPLTHIIRNSCDHGIETPEIRRQKGKAEQGKIEIKAYHEGGQVFIEVKDDGKGLCRSFILNKAIEKNLVSPSVGVTLSDKEVFDLIFLPGFSTASQVTSVSGRGVGMDVVRTNIEKIGGTVELSGEENVGTMIKIKIPLTLAIIPALMVKCAGSTYAIPQLKLEELVRVDLEENPGQIENLHGALIYRLRGNILQLVDLNQILGTDKKTFREKKIVNIAVLNADNNLFGVIIDEVLDTADIVVKPLNRVLKSLQIYSGATILGDGSVALIFDVAGISKLAQINTENRNHHCKVQNVINEVQDFLLVELNSVTTHAISLGYVQRLEEFNAEDIEYSGDQEVIRYRGKILPLINVNSELEYPSSDKSKVLSVVVIERAGTLYGLVVNAIMDTLSTTLDVTEPIKFHQGIIGNINTEKELVVVIDPYQIIDKSFGVIHKPQINVSSGYKNLKKVLLVEDTVFFRKMIKGLLEKNGFEVLIAQDGKEAIDVLNSLDGSIQLIISDIEMPRMNGFQMARAIRGNVHYKNLAMIAVSSRADQNYKDEGIKAGFDLYLEKLCPEILLAAISELERSNRKLA